MAAPDPSTRFLRVWIDQELCTGDGLCVQDAPDVFEFDIDGLAYVKDSDGELLTDPGATTTISESDAREVLESAKNCPGLCIHVARADDGVMVGGPDRVVSS
jgi:ferredoxin